MNRERFSELQGGITAVRGVRAAGVHCGIKKAKPDLALIWTAEPSPVAGVFTTNRVKAAPVLWCQKRLQEGRGLSAIVVNSGNANACTGRQGARDAVAMRDRVSRLLGRPSTEIFVASTGVIGKRLPISKVLVGIGEAFRRLTANGGEAAARAIMTTDTYPKEAAVSVELGGKRVVIGGNVIVMNETTSLIYDIVRNVIP